MESLEPIGRFLETQGLATFLVVGGSLFFAFRVWPDCKSGGAAFLGVVERGVVALEDAVIGVNALVAVQRERQNTSLLNAMGEHGE